jgi:poly(3-hydroxybutyrate) depolymerase
MSDIPPRRRRLAIVLVVFAVGLFAIAAVAQLGAEGDAACAEPAGVVVADAAGIADTATGCQPSDLAFWALLAGLAVSVVAALLSFWHRAPTDPEIPRD